ncbi:MAG: hypothetical protein AAFN79_20260 [Pseudomonadota bacterium]
MADVGYDAHLRIEKAVRKREGRSPFANAEIRINGIENFWPFAAMRIAKPNRHSAKFTHLEFAAQ